MKNKGSARSAGTTAKNIHISQGGRDLTAQAGLIPVVKFLRKEGIVSKTEQTVDHQRGATGLYDSDTPMDFADACLVRMSEIYPTSKIFTIDSDFRIYRKQDKKVVSLLIPNEH